LHGKDLALLRTEIERKKELFRFEQICGELFVRRQEIQKNGTTRSFLNISDGSAGILETTDYLPENLENWQPKEPFHTPTVFGILLGYPVVYVLNADEKTAVIEGVDLGQGCCIYFALQEKQERNPLRRALRDNYRRNSCLVVFSAAFSQRSFDGNAIGRMDSASEEKNR